MTERERQLEALNRATRELLAAESNEEVAEVGVESARDILQLEANAIHFYDEDVSGLVPVAQTAAGKELIGDPPTLPEGDSIAWRVYERGEPVAVDDVRADPDIYNPDTPVRSEIYLPLEEYGILIATSPTPEAFGDDDVTVGEILAANVATALRQVERKRELRARENELVRQNERLQDFANIVSHDLRNPLNVADGYLELAREDVDSDHLEEVAAALERMDALIEDVLTLARSGNDLEELRPVDLRDILEAGWRNVTTHRADLVVETDATVTADRSRLQQLLENLFRNAVEHGGADVTIVVGNLSSTTGFYVADDGAGIPEGDREDVFESGYSTHQNGTGFGLAIVREIVDLHGWEIDLTESEAGGARFEIRVE